MNGYDGSFAIPGNIALRFTRPADEPFLLGLFIEARPWLSWAEGNRDFIHALYEQQYAVMRRGQESRYPEHMDFAIERLGDPVGRLVIDLGLSDWRISEIQIALKARGTGIASHVFRGLQAAALKARIPLTLSAMMFGSDAPVLYQRLGFEISAVEPPLFHLVWYPPVDHGAFAR